MAAAKKASIPIYPIAIGRACENKFLSKRLEELALATGGLSLQARKADDLVKVFDKIAVDLRSLYLMGYYMTGETNTHYRSISVLTPPTTPPESPSQKRLLAIRNSFERPNRHQ